MCSIPVLLSNPEKDATLLGQRGIRRPEIVTHFRSDDRGEVARAGGGKRTIGECKEQGKEGSAMP
jgi:hypothetical protein